MLIVRIPGADQLALVDDEATPGSPRDEKELEVVRRGRCTVR